MKEQLIDLFSDLTEFDPSLSITPAMTARLSRRLVTAQPYSREALFLAMANGRIALFNDYPALVARSKNRSPAECVQAALKKTVGNRKYAVRCGSSNTIRHLSGRELVDRWNSNRAKVSVTDLHFRETHIESVIDANKISWFNLLTKCGDDTALQEMMSLVVSSRGGFSDSHSDAPDSSNHCFQGRKIWLMWDTFEGRKIGLEDCSRDHVTMDCSFDMTRFLKLRSARWLSIGEGQTLFLPGDYTHKVITLENYLGVGSFYVSLPNCLRTLSRWLQHGVIWSDYPYDDKADPMVMDVANSARSFVCKLASQSEKTQRRLGYDFLSDSLSAWKTQTSPRQSRKLKEISFFGDYVNQLNTL